MKYFYLLALPLVISLNGQLLFAQPDATINIQNVNFSGCIVELDVQYCNNGNSLFTKDLFLTFYNGNPKTGGSLIGTFLIQPDPAGSTLPFCRQLSIKLPKENYNLYAVINDNGTNPATSPNTTQSESNTANNTDNTTITPFGDFVDPTELIFNGNFEQGNTGFSSEYDYNNNVAKLFEGDYAVTENAQNFHPAFSKSGDHTSGKGKYMPVNGAPIAPGGSYYKVWCQTVNVEANANYVFSTWVSSVFPANPAYLQFSINGVLLGQAYTAPQDTGVWIRFLEPWFSGQNTTAEICITNLSTVATGNDFGLDDISLKKCDCNTVDVDLGADTAICASDQVIYDVSTSLPGVKYSWSTGATASAITITQAGTYSVQVTNGSCIGLDNVVVSKYTEPIVSASPDISVCNGGTFTYSATATSGDGNYTYSWTGPDGLTCNNCQTVTLPADKSRTGYVQVTDGNGCKSNIDSMVTTALDVPSIKTPNDTSVCSGSSVLIDASASGGSGNYNYNWTSDPAGFTCNGCTPTTLQVNNSTKYIVEVTDGNGCTSPKDTFEVNTLDLPKVIILPDITVCAEDSVKINSTVTGGDGNYTYDWNSTGIVNCTDCASLEFIAKNSQIYYLQVTDGNNCMSIVDSTSVLVNSNPVVTAGNDKDICTGDATLLNGSANGGDGNYTYQWSPATGLSDPSVITPDAFPTESTTYTLVVTDGNGCSNPDTASVTVNVHDLPNADAGPNGVMCRDGSVLLNASGGAAYSWSPATGLSNSSISNPIATPTVTTTYTVTVTDLNGCVAQDNATVTVNNLPSPNANAQPDAIICYKDIVQLNASGGSSYSWSPATGLNDVAAPNPTATPVATTTYYVQVTDANGCSQVDSVKITVNDLPLSNPGDDRSICRGKTTSLSGIGGVEYEWLETGESTATIDVAPSYTTTYNLVVTDQNGCKDTTSVTVYVLDLPDVSISADTNFVFDNKPIHFHGFSTDSIVMWDWDFGDGQSVGGSMQDTPEHEYQSPGIYKIVLTVTDNNGCIDTAHYSTRIVEGIKVPNVFTPDGDGRNDYFVIDVSGSIEYELTIYNRWGTVMFYSDQENVHWDGRNHHGRLVSEGTYFYILNVKFLSQNSETETGPATLIRGTVNVQ